MKKLLNVGFLCLLFLFVLSGCGKAEQGDVKKGKNWNYTVVPVQDCPKDFLKEIEKKKVNELQMTYEDGTYLYIAVGYGEQSTGGYSIKVQGLYEKGQDLCIETSLIGPDEDAVVRQKASYPYIIVKTERTEKNIEFI